MSRILRVRQLVDGLERISSAKPGDAGIDLRASGRWVPLAPKKDEIEQDEYSLGAGERVLIKTGIQVEIPEGFWGNIRDRSGLAYKNGLHVLAGVVDETYRGEVGVVMTNLGFEGYTFKKNERVAQMVITPYERVQVEYADELSDTARGEGGFGSTGKH